MRFLIIAVLLLLQACASNVPLATTSADGVTISYAEAGAGSPTLLFIHGWTCDRSFWAAQTAFFARDHRVVAVDLAGHGQSSADREVFSMAAFAGDAVAAVGDAEQVVVIGHSMGGPVAVAAAKALGDRAIGIVVVDSLQSVAAPLLPAETREALLGPLEDDYAAAAAPLISAFFVEQTDAALRERIEATMLAPNPRVAVSAAREFMAIDYAALLADVDVPLVAINSSYRPTDAAALSRLKPDSTLELMDGVGHFLMMEQPAEFNRRLAAHLDDFAKRR